MCMPGSKYMRYCGGVDAFFLAETEMYVRSNGQPKALGASWWENISTETKSAEQVAFFRHALLKLALTGNSPPATVVKKMFSKESMTKAVEADGVMKTVRDLLSAAGVQIVKEPRVVNILGVADINILKSVFSFGFPENEKKYSTASGVGHDCLLLLSSVLQQQLVSPWASEHVEAGSSKDAAPAAVAERMRELNPDGSLKNQEQILADGGFQSGVAVRRRSDKLECEIKDVIVPMVQLRDLRSGGLLKVNVCEFLGGEWTLFKAKSEPEFLMNLSSCGPDQCLEFVAAKTIAEIHLEMHSLVQAHQQQKLLKSLAVQLKPGKGLVSKASFPKHKLVLVPHSYRVTMRAPKPEPLPNAVKVVVSWSMDQREFWVQASNRLPKEQEEPGKDFVSPYFCVASTDDEEGVNMVLCLSGTKQSKVRIPLLKNSKALQKDDHLSVLKEVKVQDDEPPAKRSKK